MRYDDLVNRCSEHMDNNEYQQAYELIPSMRNIFYRKQLYSYYALVCWKAKKYDEMLEFALIGIKIMSKRTDVELDKYCFFSAGIAYGRLRNIPKALEYLKIATEMDVENSMFNRAYDEMLKINIAYESLISKLDNFII